MLYKSKEVNGTSWDVIGSKNKNKLFKVFQSLAKKMQTEKQRQTAEWKQNSLFGDAKSNVSRYLFLY